MNGFLSDVLIETGRAAVLGAIFIYAIFLGRKHHLGRQPGWLSLVAGFGALFFGSLIDITDNFPVLNRFIIIGETGAEAFLEKVVGYTLGSFLLAAGFWKWLPAILGLREAQEKTESSERYYRSLIDNSFDIITVLDTHGAILFQSPSFRRIFGYEVEELNGKSVFDYVHPEDAENVRRALQAAGQQPGEYQHSELRFRHKDGTWRRIEVVGKYMPESAPGMVIVNSRDVTERQEFEERLRESEEKFKSIFENAADGILVADAETKQLITGNSTICRMLGYGPEELGGMALRDLHPPEAFPRVMGQFDKQVKGEIALAADVPVRRKDGSVFYVDSNAFFITIGGKRYLAGIFRDITERKRAGQALRDSRRMLVKAEEIGRMGCWEWNIATNEVVWSDEVYRIYGLNPATDKPSYQLVLDTVCPEYQEAFRKAIEDCLERRQPFDGEYCILRPDGSRRETHTRGEVLYDAAGEPMKLYGIVQDITERVNAEKENRALAREWQKTFDSLATPLFILDAHSRIARCNEASLSFLNRSRDEIVGRRCWEMMHGTSEPIPDCPMSRMKKTLTRESLVLPVDDRVVEIIVDPLLDEEGRCAGAVHIIDDITDRKRTEQELLKARNLESLGILAGGIAHDFNNLLQGLLGNITLAKLDTPASSRAFAHLDSAEKLYAVASGLTKQLLAFATGGGAARETIQPGGFIRDTVAFSLSGSNVKAVFALAEDLRAVNVDKSQLHQVLSNIVFNARDAMAGGGLLLVQAENERIGERDGTPALAPGPYVRISLQDHGRGISKKDLLRIFDPYFSTKERGHQKGMGLGLPISDTIVRKHGGSIRVESEVGRGTTFHVYLPAVVSSDGKKAPQAESGKAGGGQDIRILVMDDELAVAEVAGKFLRRSGFRVDAFVNGEEAIRAYQAALAAGDPYAVAILDITIPGGMGGKEAIINLRRIDPGVKAIVSSGYTNDPIFTDFAAYGFAAGIAKPYRLEAMEQTIRAVLAG